MATLSILLSLEGHSQGCPSTRTGNQLVGSEVNMGDGDPLSIKEKET